MSRMRNTYPRGGGPIPMLTAARSAGPEMSAGVWSVVQTRRDVTLRLGRTTLCGLAPSNSTTALPFSSTVVTTRRMSSLRGMNRSLPGADGVRSINRHGRACHPEVGYTRLPHLHTRNSGTPELRAIHVLLVLLAARKTWMPAQASLRSLRTLGCERGHDGGESAAG